MQRRIIIDDDSLTIKSSEVNPDDGIILVKNSLDEIVGSVIYYGGEYVMQTLLDIDSALTLDILIDTYYDLNFIFITNN